jgi:uncharacterized membrane protein YfcA
VTFDVLLAAASVVAGTIASVAGSGIGSVLTPVFALRMDMKLAVAASPCLTSSRRRFACG